jgi:hypothetical protein
MSDERTRYERWTDEEGTMSRPSKAELLKLSIPEIEELMGTGTPLARLEARKADLQAQIARIEADLARLARGFTPAPARKRGRRSRGGRGIYKL